MKNKIRIDVLLVEKGLAGSRTKAQSLVMGGHVYQQTQRIDKVADLVSTDAKIIVKGKDHPYVGRGGVKLKSVIDHFKINVEGKICLDTGASTGGFTDCLLKEGAKKVYAVDVGYGQLDWSLQKDARVVMIDRTNFRNFDVNLLEDPIDVVTVDVSFISLTKIIPKVVEVLSVRAQDLSPLRKTLITLIKPQFEVGRANISKGGIVCDQKAIDNCLEKIKEFTTENGFKIEGIIPSPIKGADGNQEYLMTACMGAVPALFL